MENNKIIIWFVGILAILWSAWVFYNFPQSEQAVFQNIGYMEVWNVDGTGPYDESKWDIRCFTDRGGEKLVCPVFTNWAKTQKK